MGVKPLISAARGGGLATYSSNNSGQSISGPSSTRRGKGIRIFIERARLLGPEKKEGKNVSIERIWCDD